MNKISIIMPCYKPDWVVERAVEGFAMQNSKEYIDLIMVNDNSPHTKDDYQHIINKYKDKINIQYYKTPENCGPGAVRNYGYHKDSTNNNYVIFHDDDEYFTDPNAINKYIEAINKNPNASRYPATYKIKWSDKEEIIPGDHSLRLSAECFNKSFLDACGINFDTQISYCGEDRLFLETLYFFEHITDIYASPINCEPVSFINYTEIGYDNTINKYGNKNIIKLSQYYIRMIKKLLLIKQAYKYINDQFMGKYTNQLDTKDEMFMSLYITPYVYTVYSEYLKNKDYNPENNTFLNNKLWCRQHLIELKDLLQNLSNYFPQKLCDAIIKDINTVIPDHIALEWAKVEVQCSLDYQPNISCIEAINKFIELLK